MKHSERIVRYAVEVVVAASERRPELITCVLSEVITRYGQAGLFWMAWVIAGGIDRLAQPGDVDRFLKVRSLLEPLERDGMLLEFLNARQMEEVEQGMEVFGDDPEQALLLMYSLTGIAGGMALLSREAWTAME